jgi:hypothetical protein
MLYCYLVLNIWFQSSRSWDFAATSETPWNFSYKSIAQENTIRSILLWGNM